MGKEITGFRPGSLSWKKFMAKVYGWGASIVIVGALFKLEHYKGASAMLIIGLGTEAIIFFLSAFEPVHEDPDWSLVYPELAEDYEGTGSAIPESSESATEALDRMMYEAKIGPELIESLGAGIRKLADTTESMNNLGDVSEATNGLVKNMTVASERVESLSTTYETAAEALTGISAAGEEGSSYAQNLHSVNQNLSNLNKMYEMQLESASSNTSLNSAMNTSIKELIQNLQDSVEDTRRYKENIAELSTNLESLNTVYGNMLSAMNYNRPQ